jgi:hypothetical protein
MHHFSENSKTAPEYPQGVPLLTGLPCIYFSSWAKGKADENKINNSTTIDWVTIHIFLVMGQSIVVLLLILSSLALLLAHDEKYMHGSPVNSGTLINLIFVGLTLGQ